MVVVHRLPKHIVLTILRHRGFTTLRTKRGEVPIEKAPEYQLWGVYRSGCVIKKKEV